MANNNQNKKVTSNSKHRLKGAANTIIRSTDVIDNNANKVVKPINKAVKFINDKLDFLLTNSVASKLLALGMSIMLFISVTQSPDINVFGVNNVGKNLSAVPVTALYDREKFQVEGLPETVDMTLVGSVEAIRRTEVLNQQEVIIDLTNYQAGINQTVSLLYSGIASGVNITFSQPTFTINIYEREEEEFMIFPELVRLPLDNEYTYDKVVLSQDRITIRAARHTLDSIARVQALIDVSGHHENFSVMAPLNVIDLEGLPLSNLDLSMDMIQVDVNVTQR